jgi:hypothetical protein
MRRYLYMAMAGAALLAASGASEAATVWTGPTIVFTKQRLADPALPANQDRLTDRVALTRGSTAGLYNPLRQQFYSEGGPAGTRWAFAGLEGNPETGFSAANHPQLRFSTWEDALGGRPALAGNILDRPAVVHLVEEDAYLDINFTDWGIGGGGGGSFSYTRTSPAPPSTSEEDIPLPLPALLALGAVLAAAGSRRLARGSTAPGQAPDDRRPPA